MRIVLALVALVAGLAIGGSASRARACASCGAGDPTLQIAGTEQPFAGRARLAGVLQHSSYADAEATVLEQRLLLGASLALADVAMLTLALPVVWRETSYPTLAHDTTVGLGDADVRLRATLFRDRAFAPAHRLALEIGARLPTGPALERQGALVPLPAQLGTGAFEPLLGASWISILDDTTLWLSAQGAFPMTGFAGWRNGVALRSSLAVQWQPLREIAVRAALDSRLEGWSGRASEVAGDPSFLLFAGGGFLVSPSSDMVIHLLVRVPCVQLSDGAHASRTDGVSVETGVALDV